MDCWEEKPYRSSHRHQRDNPSFSSTLLDAIYRSIDESNSASGTTKELDQEELVLYRSETMRKKHYSNFAVNKQEVERGASSFMVDKWMMEKKVVSYEKAAVRRKSSMADFDDNNNNKNKPPRKELNSFVLLNSCSSSSESSCGGGFSSSESDQSFYGLNYSRSPTHTMQQIRPKPIRTSSISARPASGKHQRALGEIDMHNHHHHHPQKPKHEGGFNKAKTKALKIYGDLKKVKQPISPGGRLASFLNSIFTAGNAKKAKISSSSSGYQHSSSSSKLKLSEQTASTCSSASSFSRSCLSKTPSSRGKLSNGTKRSVSFCPVSVIVDEDCRPCGHKTLYGSEESPMAIPTSRNTTNDELKFRILNENRRVEEVARELLKNYQIRKKQDFDMRDACNGNETSSDSEQEDDDDDAASYASSDLFELDNLSAIGIERYREELPVYETTYLGTNRPIANGLIV